MYDELPATSASLHARYQFHQQQGQQEEAAECLQRLQSQFPGNGFLCHSLGLAAQQDGQCDSALAHFQKGTASPDLEAALLNFEGLAELHAFRGRHAEAAAAWQAGGRRGVSSRFLRQWALYEKKRAKLDEAAMLFERSHKVNAQVSLVNRNAKDILCDVGIVIAKEQSQAIWFRKTAAS